MKELEFNISLYALERQYLYNWVYIAFQKGMNLEISTLN